MLTLGLLAGISLADSLTGQKILQLAPGSFGLQQIAWTNSGPHEVYVYTVQVVNNDPSFALGPYWVDIPSTGNLLLNAATDGMTRDFTPNWIVVEKGEQIRLSIEGAQHGVEVIIWTTNPYYSSIYL